MGLLALLHEDRQRGIDHMLELAETKPGGYAVCEDTEDWCQEAYMDAYFDNVTGRELDPAGVKIARQSEIDFINSMGVWEVIPRTEVGDAPILKGRWVDVNKGDVKDPNYRSRYVAKEIKKGARSSLVAEFFAAMPPLSCSKLLLILAVTRRIPDAHGKLQIANSAKDLFA